MKYYYTAQEARQRLNTNVGTFYYLIETGKIKKIMPSGKKRGYYSKYQIEKLAKERLTCIVDEESSYEYSTEEPKTTFTKASLEDIHEEFEFATLLLNRSMGYGIPASEAWLSKNPATNFIVKDQGQLVAYIQALPIKREIIDRWIKGEFGEWEISKEDVLPYTPGSSMECIILGIATTPNADRRTRCNYGVYLIRHFLNFLCDLAQQDITITRFYIFGTTPEEITSLKRARFEERGRTDKRVAFELNPLIVETQLARAYRAALKQRKTFTES